MPSTTKEWRMRCRECPLPAVREQYDEDGMNLTYVVERCGHPLRLLTEGNNSIMENSVNSDFTEPKYSQWSVACDAGHVVLVHDTEDRDVPFSIRLLGLGLAMAGAYDDAREGTE